MVAGTGEKYSGVFLDDAFVARLAEFSCDDESDIVLASKFPEWVRSGCVHHRQFLLCR